MEKALLTQEEITLAKHCLNYALEQGADAVRITLTKSLMNLVGLLNGEVDKTAHALDRSMQFQLFADGRFGSFSSTSGRPSKPSGAAEGRSPMMLAHMRTHSSQI